MENEIDLQLGDGKRRAKLFLIVGFSAIITVSLISYTAYLWQKTRTEQLELDYQKQITALRLQQAQQKLDDARLNDLNTNYQNNPNIPQDSAQQPITIDLEKITVDWEKKLSEMNDNCAGDKCYLVGKITNEDPRYSGKPLYLVVTGSMGGNEMSHFIIEKNESGIDEFIYAENTYGEETRTILTGINDLPEEITFPETNYRLKKHYSPSQLFSEVKADEKLFTDSKIGNFYLTKEGCIVAELPDHTAIAYDFILPFISDQDKILDIKFDDNKKNKDEYDYINHSCGGVCTFLSEMKIEKSDMEVIGKTVSGEDIYRLKDPKDARLKDLYDNKNTLAYYGEDYNQQGKNKYSYDEFIKLNPYLFWKDPLGRWIQFTNNKFASAAEMCKPVIYLYPQEKTGLDLKINLNGSLTKTEPQYNDGWKISATPEGKIMNIADNQYYDYLLWEGIGINYPEQTNGWVVEQANLGSFFDQKLALLGLNKKEAGDFKEYWLARLNEKPFYKISFLSRQEFDSLASIEFSPVKPKTFIRVMMTAKGLDEYASIKEQILPASAPRRNGFTAIEWGGALLK